MSSDITAREIQVIALRADFAKPFTAETQRHREEERAFLRASASLR
jgi:hypothetical protein